MGMKERCFRGGKIAALALVALAAACGGEQAGVASGAADVPPAADTLPGREAALDRFRAGLGQVDSLAPVATHRDSLVLRFVRAVEAADTAALAELLLTPAEFAWLYYPSSPQGFPPYDVAADLMWDLLSRQTERGALRLLRLSGGRPLGYAGYDCPAEPEIEGANRIWGPCRIRYRTVSGNTVRARMTGPILERDGRFKFVSLTNDID
jgi:hypothetical protein